MLNRIIKSFTAFTLFITFSVVGINAKETRGPINPTVVTVNRNVTAKLQANGCYADAYFNIKGTYLRDAYGTSVSEINLKTTYTGHNPPDWAFVFDGAQNIASGGSVKIIIRYHFNTSYIDCPISGGYKYDAITVYV